MSELSGGDTGYCSIDGQFSYLNLTTIVLNADTQFTYYLHKDMQIPWKVEKSFSRNISWLKSEEIPDSLLQPAGKILKTKVQIGTNNVVSNGQVYFGRLHCISDGNYWQITQSKKEFFIGDPNFTGIS
jgi:hypothetical protein